MTQMRGRINGAPHETTDIGHLRTFHIDQNSHVMPTISGEHSEIHAGQHYIISISSADMGAIAAPADMLTLSFVTADTTKRLHMLVGATSSAGARFRFIEGKSGGGITPGGRVLAMNNNRSIGLTSEIIDMEAAPAAGAATTELTLFTGGVSLVDTYIGATGLGNSLASGQERGMNEWYLAPNTQYQLSLYNTANVPGALSMSYYGRIPEL